MLRVFSGVALLLSAMLTATILGGMLAQQARQIGVMKIIGARPGQIAAMYLAMVFMIAPVATALGTWAGVAVGRAFSGVVLREILNFTMHSGAVPASSDCLLAAVGVLLPLILAAIAVLQASRTTVQAALANFGNSRQEYLARARWLDLLPWTDRSLSMALRNTLRRRSRLLLSAAIGAFRGNMLFGICFPLVLSLKAMLIWLDLVLASATLASASMPGKHPA